MTKRGVSNRRRPASSFSDKPSYADPGTRSIRATRPCSGERGTSTPSTDSIGARMRPDDSSQAPCTRDSTSWGSSSKRTLRPSSAAASMSARSVVDGKMPSCFGVTSSPSRSTTSADVGPSSSRPEGVTKIASSAPFAFAQRFAAMLMPYERLFAPGSSHGSWLVSSASWPRSSTTTRTPSRSRSTAAETGCIIAQQVASPPNSGPRVSTRRTVASGCASQSHATTSAATARS